MNSGYMLITCSTKATTIRLPQYENIVGIKNEKKRYGDVIYVYWFHCEHCNIWKKKKCYTYFVYTPSSVLNGKQITRPYLIILPQGRVNFNLITQCHWCLFPHFLTTTISNLWGCYKKSSPLDPHLTYIWCSWRIRPLR